MAEVGRGTLPRGTFSPATGALAWWRGSNCSRTQYPSHHLHKEKRALMVGFEGTGVRPLPSIQKGQLEGVGR